MFGLLGGAADGDGVGAQEGGQHARADAEIDGGHGLGDSIHVVRAAAHPTHFFRNEQQVQPNVPI